MELLRLARDGNKNPLKYGKWYEKLAHTPLKFNMEPENQPLEKEICVGNHHFEVPC